MAGILISQGIPHLVPVTLPSLQIISFEFPNHRLLLPWSRPLLLVFWTSDSCLLGLLECWVPRFPLSWYPCFGPLQLFLVRMYLKCPGIKPLFKPSLQFLCLHFFLHFHCSFLCRFFPKHNASPCNPSKISLIVIHLFSLCLSASLFLSHIHTYVYARICIYLYRAFFFQLSNFLILKISLDCILPKLTILYFIKVFSNIGRLILCCRIISKDTFFF